MNPAEIWITVVVLVDALTSLCMVVSLRSRRRWRVEDASWTPILPPVCAGDFTPHPERGGETEWFADAPFVEAAATTAIEQASS